MLKNPELILLKLMEYKVFRFLSDENFIKLEYLLKMRKKLNLENPKTFNEKLLWLKLHDRNPKYTQLVDKYEVRKHIKKTIGENHLIPLYVVYDNYDQINFSELPNQFVLKPNHTSGNYYICKDKTKINLKHLKQEVNAWLDREYYWVHREWPYKNIKPKIVAEKYLEEFPNQSLKDYKIMCFNGEPKIIQVMSDRTENGFNISHYDINWNELNIDRKYISRIPTKVEKPKNLNEMIAISKNLSQNLPFVRVDLYSVNDSIFFGELTFYPVSGFMDFANEGDDRLLGDMINLPIS